MLSCSRIAPGYRPLGGGGGGSSPGMLPKDKGVGKSGRAPQAVESGESSTGFGHGHVRIRVLLLPKLNYQPEKITPLSSLGWG